MSTNQFLEQLAGVLPTERLLTRQEDLAPYECDGLTALRELPLAVAIPETESEILKLLAVCRQHSIAVVTRGAGTGLSGRPLASPGLPGLANRLRFFWVPTRGTPTMLVMADTLFSGTFGLWTPWILFLLQLFWRRNINNNNYY